MKSKLLLHVKFFIIFPAMLILFLLFQPLIYADSSWESVGFQLGQAIGNGINSIDKERKDYVNDRYDFSKVKNIFVKASIPQSQQYYVYDQRLPTYCFNTIHNILKEKNKNNIFVADFNKIANHVIADYTEYQNHPSGNMTPAEFVGTYIILHFESILYIDIDVATIMPDGSAMAVLTLTLKDSFTDEIIFQRKEIRTDYNASAWGRNASLKPTKEIIEYYIERLNKEINKSKKSGG